MAVISRKTSAAQFLNRIHDRSLTVSAHHKEIRIRLVAVRILPPIDPVSVDYDHALPGLPENLRQPYGVNDLAGYDIPQYIARSHRRQLIRVSYENQPCAADHRFGQCIHQKNIHHGHFIDDDHILLQRVFFIFAKIHAVAVLGIIVLQ